MTSDTARGLAVGAVAGSILFTLAWFVLGFVSPGYTLFGTLVAPYSPISQPVSRLGLGLTASFMNAAFVFGGLLIMIGAVGIFTLESILPQLIYRTSTTRKPRKYLEYPLGQ